MEKLKGFKIAGFVLGLLSTITGGLILAILGLVFSLKCKKQLKEENTTDGLVTAGFILSIIGLARAAITWVVIIFTLVSSIFFGALSAISDSSSSSYRNSSYNTTNRNSSYSSYYKY